MTSDLLNSAQLAEYLQTSRDRAYANFRIRAAKHRDWSCGKLRHDVVSLHVHLTQA